jgi:diaminopimelate epimerase
MQLEFTKMHSLGNDFMVIDGVRQNFNPDPVLIRQWANRRTGIGFDQLLIVAARRNKSADYLYRIFNADGGEVAQCGNGARCLAKFLHAARLSRENKMRVETSAGIMELQLDDDGQVTVNMGRPVFIPARIPFIAAQQEINYVIEMGNGRKKLCAVVLSMGNPHCVVQVDDLKRARVEKIGAFLNNQHPRFPQGVNVSFMQILDPQHIQLRIFERGVGETLACGSAASAATVAGRLLNLLAETVTVSQPGGDARVTWADHKTPVYLTGPAITVFNGVIEI